MFCRVLARTIDAPWQAKYTCEIGKFCRIFSSIAIFQTHKLITETLGIIHFTTHRIHCEFFAPHLSTTLDTRVNKMLNKFSLPWNHHKEKKSIFRIQVASFHTLRHFILYSTLYLHRPGNRPNKHLHCSMNKFTINNFHRRRMAA